MTDLINRADAIEAVRSYFKDRLGKSKCDYDEELQLYVLGKEERTMLTYNKGINDKLRSLPSADDGLRCALAGGRKCFAQGYDFTWCITCPHISEEDRQLVNHAVLAIPSADAVHGEWHQISPARIYECSICNHNVLTDYIDTYNYCPNCGAIMKGGDDE